MDEMMVWTEIMGWAIKVALYILWENRFLVLFAVILIMLLYQFDRNKFC